jgi:hypothetical protein
METSAEKLRGTDTSADLFEVNANMFKSQDNF